MVRFVIMMLLYVVAPVLIIVAFKHWKWVKTLGTVVLAYAVGIIASLCGITHVDGEMVATFNSCQSMLMNVSVSLAIPLMLFNCDFKLWTKALPKTAWALFGGVLAVMVAVFSGFYIFKDLVPNPDKVSGMMVGIYTGGTMNFNALGASLQVDKSIMAIVLAFEMIVTTPYFFFLL